ncbi:WD40 repeat-like protein [Eremomyces bilateralis CBS 781.70]|uniref:WD40 repeat-like protein n=1 Tax=Eremomyces bilateralis CBS 781.70 TaxID=1392243 RepID=A0A6G1FZQ7_9PEZI|nr:WD40 repeat-like protein [Eremomyces bilateralis CBS 781.70]KAF1811345.1 WD40 repeat-like protein [Eremomyces bilateralis CBS 781.70]
MNLALVDPFVLAQDCPEALTETLRNGHATCIRFNHNGDLLASGRLSGTIVIFDIETNGVACKLRGHTKQVQSLSWSSNDRFLLSASQDWKCILWDLQDGTKVRTIRFEAPVFMAELHPKNHLRFVAALFEDQPMIVSLEGGAPVKVSLSSMPKRSQAMKDNLTEKQAAQDAKNTATVALFTPDGSHVISGTNKGWLNIIDPETYQTLYSNRVTQAVIILVRLTASGRDMVVNSSDRIIRTFQLPDLGSPSLDWDSLHLEVEHKFQDLVNRLSWNHVTFSSTGEYVTASTWMNHDIYVWERSLGSLVKILEGPKEELTVVEWHPYRPFVAAVGLDSGSVYLWSILAPQRWSALAPDFVEVEENVDYVEKEDEFDIQPIEEIHKRRLDGEDEDVDVLTVEDAGTRFTGHVARIALVSGEEEFKMPVFLDVDNADSEDEIVAIGTGQFRKKSPGTGKEWMNESETRAGSTGVASGDERAVNGNGRTDRKRSRKG